MNDKAGGLKIIFSILALILSVALIFSVIRIAFGSDALSFTSILNYSANTPTIDISYVEYLRIGGDWGLFDGFRNFLNTIMTIFNIGIWMCKNIGNLLLFVFYYVTLLFVA